jgi:outer membrane protein
MIKKLTILTLLASSTLYADIIGGEISFGVYSHSPSGTTSYTLPYTTLNSSVDLEDDFGWSDSQDIMLKAYFENPIPFIPNVKIAYTNLSHDGESTVNGFSWGGIINLNGEVDTSADFSMYDLTLYYELLDNIVEVDAGLTLRYLDGDISVDTIANFGPIHAPLLSESTTFSMWIPMLYAKARFNIPTTDISLQAETNLISYEDTSFYDYEISARYTFTMGLGVEAGYKSIHLDSDDLTDGLVVDMDFSGPYASIVWDF